MLGAMASRGIAIGLGILWWIAGASTAFADEPITLRGSWSGHVGFFATGAPLAIDGPDPDTTSVDTLAQPADVEVSVLQVPAAGLGRAAYLYWGGSIPDSECTVPMDIDDTVEFTSPGGLPMALVADACFCSDAAAASYDVQACVADVSTLVGPLSGTYTVDGFEALIDNQTTHNASFSIVLVYDDPTISPRRVALYDGLLTMSSDVTPQETITLGGLDIDSPPAGALTWYALEGDEGGSAGEGVQVTGMPGGGVLPLSDALNPVANPMNHTINTTMPPQTDVLGVDVDRFVIDPALDSADTAVEVQYDAGIDKWWLVYNVVEVSVFEPVLADGSTKDWTLADDVDGNGIVDSGDTVRYTLHLHNTGNADGIVSLADAIPAEAGRWTLVDTAGGIDASLGNTLIVEDIELPVGMTADVVFDVVIDAEPGAMVLNTAEYIAQPANVQGFLIAPPIPVGEPEDGSTGDPPGTSGDLDDTGPMTSDSGGDDQATSGSGGPSLGSTGAAASTGTEPPLPAGDPDIGGCGCRHRGSIPTGAWLLPLLLSLRRRRSAHSPRKTHSPVVSL